MQCISKLRWVVLATSGVVTIYLIAILLNAAFAWIYALYVSSVGASIWMTLRILKDPYTTGKTFDEYFYQDRPDIRRAKPLIHE